MWYTYILQGEQSKFFYKGFTNNINRRLFEHASGQCKTTRSMLPVRLIHVEICNTRIEARKLEKYFKTGYGREIVHELAEVAELVYAHA